MFHGRGRTRQPPVANRARRLTCTRRLSSVGSNLDGSHSTARYAARTLVASMPCTSMRLADDRSNASIWAAVSGLEQ